MKKVYYCLIIMLILSQFPNCKNKENEKDKTDLASSNSNIIPVISKPEYGEQ